MRIYNFFAVLLLSVLMLVSCSKNAGIEEPVEPQNQDPKTPTATLPGITFGKPSTKAMLSTNDLLTVGSQLHVYDYLTGYTGSTIEGWDPDTEPYIDEDIICAAESDVYVWNYATNGVANGAIYPWTADGIHKFFGYLTYDKKSELSFSNLGITPTVDGTTLTIPSNPGIAFTPATKQFDFLYSDVYERNAATKNYSVVPLNFRHLFTAISVEVESQTDVPVQLISIEFEGLKNKNKEDAVITFASPSSVNNFEKEFSGNFVPAIPNPPIQFAKDDIYDPLTTVFYHDNPTPDQYNRTYFMIWPQTIDDIAPTREDPHTDPLRAECEFMAADSMIVVTYKMKVGDNWDAQPRVARMKFPKVAWEAGKMYHFNIQFSDKRILLTTKVLPWDYNEYDVDYTEGTIVVPSGLKFDKSTCSVTGNVATVVSGKDPVGNFTIMAPVGGTWQVGMTGDIEYFEVSPRSGTIDPTVNQGRVTLTVTPKLNLSRPTDKQIQLKFSVSAKNREIDAQTEINRDNWIILLPSNL